jgi:two-component system response regulator CpxR
MLKVLLIDDDKELSQLLSEYLQTEGFAIDTAYDGQTALELALKQPYSVIVLDVMLPVRNGFDVLKNLRQHSQTPVIMLTAKGDTVDRVIGLEIGADDIYPNLAIRANWLHVFALYCAAPTKKM